MTSLSLIEKFEHAGCTIEIHADEDAGSPAEWDNLGTLVAFPRLARDYGFAEREVDGTELDAILRGGLRLLARYLRMTQGATIVPFEFHDYGSGGSRLWATDLDADHAAGFIMATTESIEACGTPLDRVEEVLRGELQNWSAYVEGNVVGFIVRHANGEHVDSCWGFYPDANGNHDDAKAEARAVAESHAHEEAINAEPQDVCEVLASMR